MRLTNISQLHLPFGKLYGYDVQASRDAGTSLPISFDQRAHVGRGARPGSWMAISFTLPDPVDKDDLARAWMSVIGRHGTLRTAYSDTVDGLRLGPITVEPGAWTEHEVAAGQEMNIAVRDVLDQACSPFNTPSHRLLLIETADRPTVVVGMDHSHTDMWSMLVLLRDLTQSLRSVQTGQEPSREIPPAFAEHTASLHRAVPAEVRQRWEDILAAENGTMPLFPLDLGSPEAGQAERVEVRNVLDADDNALFHAHARAHKVSTLALALSSMAEATAGMTDKPLRAVFPVHSRHDKSWYDSMGWFITNSVLEVPDADPNTARSAIREAVKLGSWPLQEVFGDNGMPESPGMFALSWLDLRNLPVKVDSTVLEAQFVSANITTDGVMLWFILDNTGMHLRCRYPDTDAARRNVGTWLDRLVAKIRHHAWNSAGSRIRANDRTYVVTRASQADIPELMELLLDDASSTGPEVQQEVYDAISLDKRRYLAVVRAEGEGAIVGTLQTVILPSLVRAGASRMRIQGLRVAGDDRKLAAALIDWAHRHGRVRGAEYSQAVAETFGEGATGVSLFESLGYSAHGIGLERSLLSEGQTPDR